MSFMKFRNRKGFTLIEMMIVIAVIAILAAVIIPKTGIVQSTVKESGVEANARIVQGIVENLAPRYAGDDDALLEAAATKIANAGIKNPITNKTDVVRDTATETTAVVYSNEAPAGANLAGVVWLRVYDGVQGIYIYPHDKFGNVIGSNPIEVGK